MIPYQSERRQNPFHRTCIRNNGNFKKKQRWKIEVWLDPPISISISKIQSLFGYRENGEERKGKAVKTKKGKILVCSAAVSKIIIMGLMDWFYTHPLSKIVSTYLWLLMKGRRKLAQLGVSFYHKWSWSSNPLSSLLVFHINEFLLNTVGFVKTWTAHYLFLTCFVAVPWLHLNITPIAQLQR